jgi:hypothetical protein
MLLEENVKRPSKLPLIPLYHGCGFVMSIIRSILPLQQSLMVAKPELTGDFEEQRATFIEHVKLPFLTCSECVDYMKPEMYRKTSKTYYLSKEVGDDGYFLDKAKANDLLKKFSPGMGEPWGVDRYTEFNLFYVAPLFRLLTEVGQLIFRKAFDQMDAKNSFQLFYQSTFFTRVLSELVAQYKLEYDLHSSCIPKGKATGVIVTPREKPFGEFITRYSEILAHNSPDVPDFGECPYTGSVHKFEFDRTWRDREAAAQSEFRSIGHKDPTSIQPGVVGSGRKRRRGHGVEDFVEMRRNHPFHDPLFNPRFGNNS